MKIYPIGHLVKTNPIQTQTNPICQRVKLMQSVYLQSIMKKNAAKGYEKNKAKTNPISEMAKMNANAFSQKDYENDNVFRLQKNKAKQSQSFDSAQSLP